MWMRRERNGGVSAYSGRVRFGEREVSIGLGRHEMLIHLVRGMACHEHDMIGWLRILK